ncbi:MAG TPA: sigma-70 family RNA polymerase sigma factor [Verrucomicrobiota bacterium]|nr:RNA polymerase sigma factor [Verrucomicrobiales bacterium]HRI14562.1 sigma-70 family RNA polymerase sigma factor [Verrucomicrobiota bacterium]
MEFAEQQRRFADWTRDHSAIVHHVVNAFAAGDDRNDLLQEVLLAAWKSIPAFRDQAKPTTYLYRVCHNAALLWIRTEKNYRRRVEQFGAFAPAESVDEASSLTDERLAQLYTAIHQLKPLDRSLILLSLDGLSYRDMSEVLGLSESNVGVKLNRIKAQLTQTMTGNDDELR